MYMRKQVLHFTLYSRYSGILKTLVLFILGLYKLAARNMILSQCCVRQATTKGRSLRGMKQGRRTHATNNKAPASCSPDFV